MKTFFKVLGAVVAVITALIIVLGIAVWLLFDPNDYKDYLAQWVSERSGREFVIDDDLELTFFPWLGVTTGNVRMGNAPGFGDEDFASIEAATVSVRLLPLLQRRVEVGAVRLDGLELNLATDAQGGNNWGDLLTAGTADDAATLDEPGAASPFLESLNIAGVVIENGLVFWRENATDVRYVVSELSLRTQDIASGAPVDLELGFRLVSVEPQLTAEVMASGTGLLDAAASRIEGQNLRVAFNLADAGGNERAAGTLQAGNLRYSPAERNADLTQGSLTAMVAAPPVGPAELELKADWSSARLDLQGGTLEFDELTTEAAGITASWSLNGRDLLDQPVLSGNVRITSAPIVAVVDALDLEVAAEARGDLGNLSLSADFVALPPAGELSLTNLSAALLGMTIDGEFTAATDGSAQGRFATNAFDPARLTPLLPADTAAAVDVHALGPARLAASVRYDPSARRLSLTDIGAEVLGADLSGEVHRIDSGSSYEGRAVVQALDGQRLATLLGERMPEALAAADLGTLALSTRFDYLNGAETLELTELEAGAAGLELRGDLRMTRVADSQNWAGNLEVLPFDPRALMTRLKQPAPELADPTALRRATLAAQIDVDDTSGVFRSIRMQVDDSTVTGDFTVTFTDPAAYEFQLEIDRIDADRYMPPAAEAPEAAPAVAVAADIALPTELLRRQNLDGEISIGRLGLAGLSLSQVSSRVSVHDGLGIVDETRTALYGGAFEGRLELDARPEIPRLALNGTATSIQLDPLLTDLRGEANMSGASSFDLQLSGSGEQLTAVLDSSQGRVAFSVRDGEIRGFNLGHALCSAYNATQSQPRPAATNEQLTRFELVRGSADVQEGIARTRDLEATTAFLKVTGQGQSDIVSREINYDLIAELTGSITIPRCETMDPLIGDSIPVSLTGTITAPDIQPDYGEIVRQRVRGELGDRLRQRLEERLR